MKHACSGRVYSGRIGTFGCSSSATRQYEGKWWCFHHDPREREKKRAAKIEKWDREQKREDEIGNQANELLKRLRIKGSVAYHWKLRNMEAVTISFEEVEKLLKELGR